MSNMEPMGADRERNEVEIVLDELAGTIDDQPALLDGVNRRVVRLRRRRRVARATAGVAVCGLTAVGVALRHPSNESVALGASSSATADCLGATQEPAVPTDDAGLTVEKTAVAAAELPTLDAKGTPPAAGQKAIEKGSAAAVPGERADEVGLLKFIGTVVGAPAGDEVVVRVEDPALGDISFTLAGTQFSDAGTPSTSPTLVDGDRVGVLARLDGAGYVALALMTHVDAVPAPAPPEVVAELHAKGFAMVTARDGAIVTLSPVHMWPSEVGPLTADLTTVKATHFDGSACASVDMAPGQYVVVLAERNADGPWAVTAVAFD